MAFETDLTFQIQTGEVITCSAEDYPRLVAVPWRKQKAGKHRIVWNIGGSQVILARYVVDAKPLQVVHYKDGNHLNVTRRNLSVSMDKNYKNRAVSDQIGTEIASAKLAKLKRQGLM